MLLNTQSNAVQSLVYGEYKSQLNDDEFQLTIGNTFIFFGLWYVFSILTNECTLPSGLLVPGMMCGAAIGSVYNEIRVGTFGFASMDVGDDSSIS